MTVQPDQNSVILRLAHMYAVGEDNKLSNPVTVDLTKIFSKISVGNVQEVSLTTNQDINKMKSMKWNLENGASDHMPYEIIPFDGKSVTINPMDIRTFIFSPQK
jgi:hypothetical protein